MSAQRARPHVVSFCKTCLGPNDLKPLPAQEAISPGGVVHYGLENGKTLCGHDTSGAKWWRATPATGDTADANPAKLFRYRCDGGCGYEDTSENPDRKQRCGNCDYGILVLDATRSSA